MADSRRHAEDQPDEGRQSPADGRRDSGRPHYGTSANYPGYAPYGFYPDYMELSPDIDWRSLLQILLRKRMTILLTACFVLLIAVFYITTATEIYEAKSQIELSLRRPRIMGQQEAVINDMGQISSMELFNTQLLKLTGPTLRREVAKKILQSETGLNMTEDQLFGYLQANATLTLIRRSSLVSITARHENPAIAATIANTYASAGVQGTYDSNREDSESAVNWLKSQAAQQAEVLQKAEQKLLDFRSKSRIESLELQLESAKQGMLAFNQEMVAVQTRASLVSDMLDNLSSLDPESSVSGNIPSTIPLAADISRLFSELSTAISERGALLGKYTEKHPEVEAKDQMIASIRNHLKSEIERARKSAQADLKLYEQQAETLKKKQAQQEAGSVEMEQQIAKAKADLSTLQRETDACEISYNGILLA